MEPFKSTKKFLTNPENIQIILLFLVWRIWIFAFALLGVAFIPLHSRHFLGGGIENYSVNPLLWGWANFDGEHYLAIAQNGYKALEHSFFPLYPILIRLFGGDSLVHLVWSGLVISNVFFLGSLFLFWKLLRLDYSERVTFFSTVSLLAFPTSFYFGAVYTESMFLFFTLLFFYFVRKGFWWQGGILGAFASATRVFGILLLPALIVEWWQKHRDVKYPSLNFIIGLMLIPLGMIAFMWFLYATTGSPLTFYTDLSPFGEQRGDGIVLLPQIFWRYAKIFLTVSRPDPLYFTVSIEALTAIFSLLGIVWGFTKKLRISYLSFTVLGYVIATLPGSFSSLPRYVLVLFPLFILLGLFLTNRGKILQLIFLVISVILLTVETVLFMRGYWVG